MFWESVTEEVSAAIDVLQENGDLELPDTSLSQRIASKTTQIMKLTGASQLLLKEKQILVRGGVLKKRAVAKYVNIILNEMVPSGYADSDMLRIFVSRSFADSLEQKSSLADIELSESVLIVVEKDQRQDHPPPTVGDLVEVEVQPGVWRMAAIISSDRSTRVQYCHHHQQEKVALTGIRRARAIAIFGHYQRRLAAALKIVAAFETESLGAWNSLHSNPYFQGQRLGVVSEELAVKSEVIKRLERSPFLKQILKTTGCTIRFFLKPVADKSSFSKCTKAIPCVLAAGSLEERWKGLQIIKVIALGMEHKRHPTLPAALLGDARRVTIPKDMMSVVVGKQMESLLELMELTSTVILPLKDRESQKADKEMDKLLDMMMVGYDDIGDQTCEIAILGEPYARAWAEAKIRALVEKHHPGYSEKDMGSSQAAGLGVEGIPLAAELEQIEERVQLAKQLAGATGCVVEVGAGRAFIAGRKGSRALCSEYISWVNDGLQFHVDLKRRADTAIRPEVPLALTEMPWLQQQLSELAIDTSTIAFFDNEEGREGQLKRLIFAGNDIESNPGVVPGLLAHANALLDKAKRYKDQGWLLEDDERENGGSTEVRQISLATVHFQPLQWLGGPRGQAEKIGKVALVKTSHRSGPRRRCCVEVCVAGQVLLHFIGSHAVYQAAVDATEATDKAQSLIVLETRDWDFCMW
ncbi:unnamed protein product [Durusdinium trenchii]|uniref:Uncharacterized protein n=1 Tax=Durusdinium trenchii TaxID=1381693 RepID=A0ABP0R0Y9_9DINO